MAQHSLWRVKFHVGNAGTQYNAFIGISGGSRKDGQTASTQASIITAITNNLLGIIKEMGNTTLVAGPSGAVVIDSFEPAPIPDCWE